MERFDVGANYRNGTFWLALALLFTLMADSSITYWLAGFMIGMDLTWLMFTWYIHQAQKESQQ